MFLWNRYDVLYDDDIIMSQRIVFNNKLINFKI